MYSELASTLVELIRTYEGRDPARLSQADFDELAYIYGIVWKEFPRHFQAVANDFKFHGSSDSRRILFERLVRILNVHDAVPAEFRNSGASELSEDALLPKFILDAGDRERVLHLCNQMRKIIFGTPEFDEPHRRRLLNRIAAIESEVHKPKGMFDVVRGGVSDIGEVLGKFGKDIKPLVDRMTEVNQIARKNISQYDQIPAPEEIHALPAPESNE